MPRLSSPVSVLPSALLPARILDPFLRPEPPPFLFLSQKMPRFFTGDELGNVKSFMYAPSSTAESKVTITTLYDASGKGKGCAVQKLAIHTSGDGPIVRCQELCLTPTHSLGLRAKLVVARVDGSVSVSKVHAQGLDTIREWTEPRLKPAQRYVGLAASSAYVFFFLILRRHRGQLLNQFSRGLYSCTSNGALRFAPFGSHVDAEPSRTAVLRMRLCSWRLAPDGTTFSYGGDEASSQSGTSRPPLCRNCNHCLQPPAQNRPDDPKTPGSANAAPSHSFPENCGERKMYVSVAMEHE